ncbi:MAG: substrate-binding domain-containing protein [Rivularia sp. (in: cyanobacteria)]
MPIIPYSRSEAGGTVGYFIEDVLRGKKFGNNLKFVPTTTKGVSEVAANDGGIYYASASEVVNQCSVKSLKLGKTKINIVALYQQPLIPPSDCSNTNRNKVNLDRFSNHEYPITRLLYVIYKKSSLNKEEPDLKDFETIKKTKRAAQAAQAYANWLKTNEGKQLLEKAGFAPKL